MCVCVCVCARTHACVSVCVHVCMCMCGVLPVPSCSAPRSRAVFWTASTTLQSINRKDNGINKDHEDHMLRQEFCRKKHALLLLTTLNQGRKRRKKSSRHFYYLISAKTSAMCIHLLVFSCMHSIYHSSRKQHNSLTIGLINNQMHVLMSII